MAVAKAHGRKPTMMIIIVAAVTAVVAGPVYAFRTNLASVEAAWGAVTPDVSPIYFVIQLLALLGHFFYTHFIFLRLGPGETRMARRFGSGASDVLHIAIIVSSAPYMPLMIGVLDDATRRVWLAIWLVLAIVGPATLGLVPALLALGPRGPRWASALAPAGSIAFTIHTAPLDALVWPALFSPIDARSGLPRAIAQAATWESPRVSRIG